MVDGKVYYVDVANSSVDSKKRRKNKKHVVFDGGQCFKVEKLTDLKDAVEIYIDTLLQSNYEEIYELLKNGVKVFLLKTTKLIKTKRLENNLRKSDENDVMILSMIPRERFREVTIREIEVKMRIMPLISRYETLGERIKTLKHWLRDTPEYSENVRRLIKDYEKERKTVGRRICREIEESMPLYCQILQVLGLKKSTELAILLTFIDLSHSRSQIWSYCKHNRRVNEHLSALASSIYVNIKKGVEISEKYRRWFEADKIGKLHRRQILARIKTQLIKDMRRTHLSLSSTNIKITTTNPRESTSHEL